MENIVVEEVLDEQRQRQKQESESENTSRRSVMRAVLLKKGVYGLSNSFVLPSFDVCLVGELDTVLVPEPNVLPILGVGNKDVKCSKCGYILAMKIRRPQLQNLAIKCPSCGAVTQL